MQPPPPPRGPYAPAAPFAPRQFPGPQFPAPEFAGTRETSRPDPNPPPQPQRQGTSNPPANHAPPPAPHPPHRTPPLHPPAIAYPGAPQSFPPYTPPRKLGKRRAAISTAIIVVMIVVLVAILVVISLRAFAPTPDPDSAPVTISEVSEPEYPEPAPVTTTPDNSWLSGETAFPGITIVQQSSWTEWNSCTAAFAGTRNGQRVAFTAAHCEGSGDEARYRTGDTALPPSRWTTTLFGNIVESKYTSLLDVALIELASGVAFDGQIGQEFTVTKMLGPDEIVIGMPVCKYGFRTERTCGNVIAVDGHRFSVNLFSLHGDSGAPAFVDLGNGEAAAVGILQGRPMDAEGNADDHVTSFSMIAPVAEEWGVTLIQ